nr:MAG TPA: hypothetical protein [Caudoviricetes sp.]
MPKSYKKCTPNPLNPSPGFNKKGTFLGNILSLFRYIFEAFLEYIFDVHCKMTKAVKLSHIVTVVADVYTSHRSHPKSPGHPQYTQTLSLATS